MAERTGSGDAASGDAASGRIAVVGLSGGARQLSAAAQRAIESAALLIGATRHLDRVGRRPPVTESPEAEADTASPEAKPAEAPVSPGAGPVGVQAEAEPADAYAPPATPAKPVESHARAWPEPSAYAPPEPSAYAPPEAEPADIHADPADAHTHASPEDPADAHTQASPEAPVEAPPAPPPAETAIPTGSSRSAQRVIVLGADRLEAGTTLELPGVDLAGALDAIGYETGPVCVLASGDPGFFGIVRPLIERFGAEALDVHPAPSSVSLAFARLGLAWDDAVVVSAHGRPLASAARAILAHPKVAVLTSPDATPQQLGRALMDLGVDPRRVAVCSHLGEPDEVVRETDLVGLGGRPWEPLSVVVLLASGAEVSSEAVLAWGLADEGFAHRGGMLTRAEVRAVALGKLALPAQGVLWDVGASSGSVAVECARLRPGLQVIAVEERPDDAARVEANALAHRTSVEVVQGTAPAALAGLPDPDRAFVGGGGLPVLDAVLARLRPGGQVVATYAALDRAAAAVERLGQLVQIGVARGRRLPDGGVRLAAENPIFVVWGPQH